MPLTSLLLVEREHGRTIPSAEHRVGTSQRPPLERDRALGGTPLSELYLTYNDVRHGIEAAGYTVARSLVDNFVTSLDMAGCSVTMSLLDEEMKRLWDAPVHTAALRWGI